MNVLLALSLLCPLAAADPPPLDDPFLERLTGTWVLRGSIAGEETTHDVTAEWVAGHQYLQIRERSREMAGDGRAAYEAVVLLAWDAARKEYQCMWLDSTAGGGLAARSIGYGKRDGDAVEFAWETAGAVSLTNTFTWEPAANAWTWRIDNIEGGKPVPFGWMRLTRE